MKASDYIAHYLEAKGVTHVFELVGGMITFLLDSLHQETSVQIVSMHHEQGAGFAAEGYGRMTGLPGIAMATSGPGATNLLTAIGSCYFDSTPAVFLTGQVNRHEQRGDRPIRQLGFQETDIVPMAKPITKAAWLVDDPAELPAILEEAFRIATTGRPGPVLIDLPLDVQRADVGDPPEITGESALPIRTELNPELLPFWKDVQETLQKARRPLILAGGGIRSSRSTTAFQGLVESLQVPVVHSLHGVDLLASENPLRLGMIGSYGNRWANLALAASDCLLVLGSRLDVRQTGADTDDFRGDKTIFHVDCEAGELNNRVQNCRTLHADLGAFLDSTTKHSLTPVDVPQEWQQEIQKLRDEWPDTKELADVPGINPNALMHEISSRAESASAFVADVGQHQMWAAQSIDIGSDQRFLTSGGMGAMGFALPAAIGASLASKNKPVVVVAGDGGFQLNIQELQTVARLRLPLKMIVLNNGSHGMVRQFQESYFHGRLQSTVWGYDAPSFHRVATAYGIQAAAVAEERELASNLDACFADPTEPFLLEVAIDGKANAYPKMAFGQPFGSMEPLVAPVEMEGT